MTVAAIAPLTESDAAMGLAVAALVGLAVGVERQWSGHASGPGARFAGARTFFLLGTTGGLAGLLLAGGAVALSTALLGGATLLVAAAYAMAARRPNADPDGTTEVAALAVLGLGAMAGLGHLQLVSASTVVVVLALHEKSRIHGFVSQLDDWEVRGALQFAVLALVILPLLPQGPYGPLGGIRPQSLWILVLIFSALNFAGYVARQVVGATRGYGYAGLAGGLVSSTAVTLTFARQSRQEPAMGVGLAAGVVGACTVLVVRVGVVTFALNPVAGRALLPYLALPLAAGLVLTAWALRAGKPVTGRAEARVPPPTSPLNLGSAVQMAVAFQLSLMALDWVRGRFGDTGVVPMAALLGLTDMDALTISMARLLPREAMAGLAAQGIAVGMLSNTVLKFALSVGLGAPGFRARAGAGLALLGAATLLGLVLL